MDIDGFLKEFNKYTKEITSSKEKSQKYLTEVGIYDKNGKLNKEYKYPFNPTRQR